MRPVPVPRSTFSRKGLWHGIAMSATSTPEIDEESAEPELDRMATDQQNNRPLTAACTYKIPNEAREVRVAKELIGRPQRTTFIPGQIVATQGEVLQFDL